MRGSLRPWLTKALEIPSLLRVALLALLVAAQAEGIQAGRAINMVRARPLGCIFGTSR